VTAQEARKATSGSGANINVTKAVKNELYIG